jgi:hypothetical protein
VDTWAEHAKVGMVSMLGVTVTMSQLDSVLRVCIALATLTYTIFKCLSAYRDYKNKKSNKNETLD